MYVCMHVRMFSSDTLYLHVYIHVYINRDIHSNKYLRNNAGFNLLKQTDMSYMNAYMHTHIEAHTYINT